MSIVKRLALIGVLLGAVVAPTGSAYAVAQPQPTDPPSDQDQQYLQAAHQSNLAEIATGRLAQERGADAEIRRLGAWFADDHSRFDTDLQRVATELGVTLPNELNPNQQTVYTHLRDAEGPEFDALFRYTQLGGHAMAMHAADKQLRQGSHPDVVQLAAGAKPVTASHHDALLAIPSMPPAPPPYYP